MRSQIFRNKVDADPHNVLFRFSLGQALFEEENYNEAADNLEPCIQARPDWMMAHILLGKALLAEGRNTEAKASLKTALELARKQHHEGPEAELSALLQSMR